MKTKILITVIFLCISLYNYGKVFIPQNGGFVEKAINIEIESINNIAKYLGYNTEQFYTYMNFKSNIEDIIAVVFKSFTDEIICIVTNDSIENLSSDRVNKYLSEFDLKKEFNSYQIESTLNDGITNKSLTGDFLADVLKTDVPEPNGTIFTSRIGLKIEFAQGIIKSFSSSDGLNKWARSWKYEQPELFESYEKAAQKYWGNNIEKIINEINIQADAWSNIPNGFQNEYVDFYRTDEGTINFKMLLVSNYNEPITLKEFKEINSGRYQLMDEFNTPEGYKRTTYRLIYTFYTFSQDGKLLSSYMSK